LVSLVIIYHIYNVLTVIIVFRGSPIPKISSTDCIRVSLNMLLMKDSQYTTNEVNDYVNPTFSKLFKDRLKLVLGGKLYINEIIKTCPYINESEIANIKLPFVQIMGFKAVLSMITLKDKSVYVVEELMKFRFPSTIQHIKEGEITKLVKALSLIKVGFFSFHTYCLLK
jgi:hypothetical protein